MISVFFLLAACLGPPNTDLGVTSDPTNTSETDTQPDPTGDCASTDADADGVNACDDCDDGDPLVFPGAAPRCDGKDSDCADGPEGDESDADQDGAPDCAACDASGYWATTRDLTGDALVAELHALSADQDCTSYSLETEFMFTRLDKESDGYVECVYTGRRVAVGNDKPDSTDMNTEHTWPQSKGAEVPPMECDLHHLYPTDSDANSARGNLPFGEVSNVDEWYGESAVGDTTSGVRSWEPRAVHKGNVARSMLYFAMRYGYDTTSGELSLYTQWHAADPVDAAELLRTETIRDRQGEANPYVVCPWLVEKL